jgi:hypothetical protein
VVIISVRSGRVCRTWKPGPWITIGLASIHRTSVASVNYPRRLQSVQACFRHTDRGQNFRSVFTQHWRRTKVPDPCRENLIGFAICGTGMPFPCHEGQRTVESPSGTVTFLFTDIEGSTGLWEEQPQAMSAHQDLLAHRRAVAMLWATEFGTAR